MVMTQELIGKIKDNFDLNLYETKVWLALLSKGLASVGEIASVSRVPRSRTYDVLESLEKKGFVIVRMGKPAKFLGVKPPMILERLKSDIRKSADEKVQILSKLKETDEFTKLEELYNQGITPVKKEEVSSSLRGKSNISNFIKEIIQNAKQEVVICTNAEEISSKFKLFSQTIDALKKAKVQVKVALSGDKDLIKEAEKKLSLKIIPIGINAKFFLIDKREVLFYISKEKKDGDDVAVWLNSPFFAEAFTSLFDLAIGGK